MPSRRTPDQRLDALIDRTYAAAADPARWSGLAQDVASTFDSTSAVLKMHTGENAVHLLETTSNLEVATKDQPWAEHWHRNDLWVERSVAVGMSRIVTSQQLVPDAEYERSAFHQDWTRPLGIYHMVGAVFPVAGETVGVLGVHRPRRGGAYEEVDRQRLSRFLPHLQRALKLQRDVAATSLERVTALDAVDRLGLGLLVVDARGRLLQANTRARAAFAVPGGVRLVRGRLTLDDPALAARLMHQIKCAAAACGASAPATAIGVQRPGRLPLTLSVMPLRAEVGALSGGCAAAIVFVRDLEHAILSRELLRELFALTPMEAAIAAALAEGSTLPEIARTFRIGLGTVRSHLKRTMAKTGMRQQSQLVSLLLRSVAVVASASG